MIISIHKYEYTYVFGAKNRILFKNVTFNLVLEHFYLTFLSIIFSLTMY